MNSNMLMLQYRTTVQMLPMPVSEEVKTNVPLGPTNNVCIGCFVLQTTPRQCFAEPSGLYCFGSLYIVLYLRHYSAIYFGQDAAHTVKHVPTNEITEMHLDCTLTSTFCFFLVIL